MIHCFFLLLKYKTYFLYFTLFVNLKVNGFIDVKKRIRFNFEQYII